MQPTEIKLSESAKILIVEDDSDQSSLHKVRCLFPLERGVQKVYKKDILRAFPSA